MGSSERTAYGAIAALFLILQFVVGAVFIAFGAIQNEKNGGDCAISGLPWLLIATGIVTILAALPCLFFLLFGTLLVASYVVFTNDAYNRVSEGATRRLSADNDTTLIPTNGTFVRDELRDCDRTLLFVGVVGLVLLWDVFAVVLFNLLLSSGYVADRIDDYRASYQRCCRGGGEEDSDGARGRADLSRRLYSSTRPWRTWRMPGLTGRRRRRTTTTTATTGPHHRHAPTKLVATKLVKRRSSPVAERRRRRRRHHHGGHHSPRHDVTSSSSSSTDTSALRKRVVRPRRFYRQVVEAPAMTENKMLTAAAEAAKLGRGADDDHGGCRHHDGHHHGGEEGHHHHGGHHSGRGSFSSSERKLASHNPPQVVVTPHEKHVHLDSKPNPLQNNAC